MLLLTRGGDGTVVDELCLTLSPLAHQRKRRADANGAGVEVPRRMGLESVLHADSLLLTHYGRMRE